MCPAHGLIFALNPCFDCAIFLIPHLTSAKLCICGKNAKESVFCGGWTFSVSLSLFPFFSFPVRISQIGRFPNRLATGKRINPPKHLCSRRSVAYT